MIYQEFFSPSVEFFLPYPCSIGQGKRTARETGGYSDRGRRAAMKRDCRQTLLDASTSTCFCVKFPPKRSLVHPESGRRSWVCGEDRQRTASPDGPCQATHQGGMPAAIDTGMSGICGKAHWKGDISANMLSRGRRGGRKTHPTPCMSKDMFASPNPQHPSAGPWSGAVPLFPLVLGMRVFLETTYRSEFCVPGVRSSGAAEHPPSRLSSPGSGNALHQHPPRRRPFRDGNRCLAGNLDSHHGPASSARR